MRGKHQICSADAAATLVNDRTTVACSGFVGAAHPEALTSAIERRFLATGSPTDITLVYAAGQGDGKTRGLNHLAHEGLIRRVIGGHWGLAPKLGNLALENKIEALCFPQGVICQLFRDIAAGRPGCITHIGLETFVDPHYGGGRLNEVTPTGAVEQIMLGDRRWLWFKSFPIDVALIRATAADLSGNLLMSEEAVRGDVLAIAQAAHNSGGIVLAQVARVLDSAIEPHAVSVPGILVDRLIVAEPADHTQTFAESYNSAYTMSLGPENHRSVLPPMPFGPRRIIASRAFDEVPQNSIANLGIGMPEGIARIASERGALGNFTLTVESGPIGGMPASGLSFGASHYPEAIIDQPAQFDFYNGGGLDFAALGAAQVNIDGDVNVSCFANRIAGMGGFADISQTARKIVFCLTLTITDAEVEMRNGNLTITKDGAGKKFVDVLRQRSFCAARALQNGQEVYYVSERAVFRLTEDGVQLVELAPGIDLQRDVLAHMGFRPILKAVRPMPTSAFET